MFFSNNLFLTCIHESWHAVQRLTIDIQAVIAQLGERQTEDLKVPGSIPGRGIVFFDLKKNQNYVIDLDIVCITQKKEQKISKAPPRFELGISCLLDRRFNQLSHGALVVKLACNTCPIEHTEFWPLPKNQKLCAQRGARTHDPEIKSLMLYRLSQPGWLRVEANALVPSGKGGL